MPDHGPRWLTRLLPELLCAAEPLASGDGSLRRGAGFGEVWALQKAWPLPNVADGSKEEPKTAATAKANDKSCCASEKADAVKGGTQLREAE